MSGYGVIPGFYFPCERQVPSNLIPDPVKVQLKAIFEKGGDLLNLYASQILDLFDAMNRKFASTGEGDNIVFISQEDFFSFTCAFMTREKESPSIVVFSSDWFHKMQP